MKIPFTKMHGIGNDYVYVNGFEVAVEDPTALARSVANRHFGVGGDGLILVLPPEPGVDADVRMRMFNADGSESEMCGNGVRCVCKLAVDRGLARANPLRVQTGAGVLGLSYTQGPEGVDTVTVDMGPPGFDVDALPANGAELVEVTTSGAVGLPIDGTVHECVLVSMGNPHAVFFVPDAHAIELERLGPRIEHHPAFPRRVNAHFVTVQSRAEATMRTWERGSGATLACGTGAAAVCAAGLRLGLTDRAIRAHLPGGDLQLEWDEASGQVRMTGTATEVFRGTWCGTE